MRLRLLFFGDVWPALGSGARLQGQQRGRRAMKSGFWKTDWFLGLVVVLVVLVFSRASELIPSLERKAYDLGVRATSREPAKNITIIAIDEESLEKIGRWPWSREVLAK